MSVPWSTTKPTWSERRWNRMLRDLAPAVGRRVGGVDRWVELEERDRRQLAPRVLDDPVEVGPQRTGNRGVAVRGAHHPDRAARVDHEHAVTHPSPPPTPSGWRPSGVNVLTPVRVTSRRSHDARPTRGTGPSVGVATRRDLGPAWRPRTDATARRAGHPARVTRPYLHTAHTGSIFGAREGATWHAQQAGTASSA